MAESFSAFWPVSPVDIYGEIMMGEVYEMFWIDCINKIRAA
jgi:hypothetical protein